MTPELPLAQGSAEETGQQTGQQTGQRGIGTCGSCLHEGSEVVLVRRVWNEPAAWDREASRTVSNDAEMWCLPCRTHYDHEGA
jgi:hypothetical protein